MKLKWSYYWLPGFKPAKNGRGYVSDGKNKICDDQNDEQ